MGGTMKDKFNSIFTYGVIVILLAFNAFITYILISSQDKKIEEMKTANNNLVQQNMELQDAIYVYDLNMKEYQSATDATIEELNNTVDEISGDVQKLLLEKEVKEKDLHKVSNREVEIKGTYQLTAYIATGNPCADGVYPTLGYTVASNDPSLWHKWIHIDGYGDYFVHDKGNMSKDVIDIFVGSYSEAIQFGRRSAQISIINKEN